MRALVLQIDKSKNFRWLEMVLIFVGVPLLYKFEMIPVHKSIPLLMVFLFCLFMLLKDKSFDRKIFGLNGFRNWKPVLLRLTGFAVLSSALILIFKPEAFLIIIKERPLLWLLIMIFYPIWSAYPQELIFRGYFFHRYRDLVKNEKLLILINAILFAIAHIIFNNWVALTLTFIGSLLFTYTYKKSRSLLVVFAEHAAFGNIVFTVGLGEFFYLPM